MQRISLTKQQLQNKAGLELLELCQTITAEGKLTDQEILSLKKWLDENAEADLRSYTYLKTIVSNILFDGKITEAEKNELYKSLEIILPPEHRTIATIRRKEVEAEKRQELKDERQRIKDEKAKIKEEEKKNYPLTSLDFWVVGAIDERRNKIINRNVRVDQRVFLKRNSNKEYGKNAIEVLLDNGIQIGYVQQEATSYLAPFLDDNALQDAYIGKILQGKCGPIPVVWGYLYPKESTRDGLISNKDLPNKISTHSSLYENNTPAIIAIVVIIILLILYFVNQ